MVDFDFAVLDVDVERYAMAPQLLFALRVVNKTPDVAILNAMLNCQLRIEPARRGYGEAEHDRLSDLFGAPERWGQTLQSFLWTHAGVSIPAFDAECSVGLRAPCSFDFNIAATKYFEGLDDGRVPLTFLFSGSIFYRDGAGQIQIGQIDWSKTCRFLLPVAVWREMMDHYYPGSAWLRLDRDVFDALYRYKRQHGFPTFECALQDLIDGSRAGLMT
jgi:Family of unknown function (DUF6084)